MIETKFIKLDDIPVIAKEILNLDVYLSDKEIEAALERLRQHFGLEDNQVIEMASNNQLPSDPCFGEWLILLGRGDLIPRGD